MTRTLRIQLLVVLVLLGSATAVLTIATLATSQEPATVTAVLAGTAYHLVDQTVVGIKVLDETLVPITDGRIAIPELGIDIALAKDGSFSLSDLPVSADPDNLTEVTVVFTAPGLESHTYADLRLFPRPEGWHLTPELTAPGGPLQFPPDPPEPTPTATVQPTPSAEECESIAEHSDLGAIVAGHMGC